MNKWQKILEDTQKNELSDNQRLWRSIAFLRLNKIQAAEETFLEGNLHFRHLLKSSLLYAEIQLKKGNEKLCLSILEDTYLRADREKQIEQWFFIAKRLKNPSAFIQEKFTKVSIEIPAKKSSEWEQIIDLEDFKNDFSSHLNFLQTLCVENQSEEKIKQHILLILEQFNLNSFQYFQIQKLVINKIGWSFLIKKIFHGANLKHDNRNLLWKSWLKICPSKHKSELYAEMQKYLKLNPDFQLEEILKSLNPSFSAS